MSSDAPGDPATRVRILDAALRLVTRKGGADVTLGDVAREARVSRQALYLHFADRAGLFLPTTGAAWRRRSSGFKTHRAARRRCARWRRRRRG